MILARREARGIDARSLPEPPRRKQPVTGPASCPEYLGNRVSPSIYKLLEAQWTAGVSREQGKLAKVVQLTRPGALPLAVGRGRYRAPRAR